MLTREELDSLEVGFEVQVDSLFPAMAPKVKTVLIVTDHLPGVGTTFTATWHGITLGEWIAHIEHDGKIKWSRT